MAYKNTHKAVSKTIRSNNFLFGNRTKREMPKPADESLLAHLSEEERKHVIAQGLASRNSAEWALLRSMDETDNPIPRIEGIKTTVYQRQRNEEDYTTEQ